MPRTSKLPASSTELVLKTLRKNAKPLSAYQILEKLKKAGIKSPPIIYRALDSLIESGQVHKINELNSFVACDCSYNHHHDLSVLTVCQKCNKVAEIHDNKIIDHLTKLAKFDVAIAHQAVVQLPIVCCGCES